MRYTIREQQTLKGIGQHYEDSSDSWTMDDVVGIVCLFGTVAYLVWLVWSVWEV